MYATPKLNVTLNSNVFASLTKPPFSPLPSLEEVNNLEPSSSSTHIYRVRDREGEINLQCKWRNQLNRRIWYWSFCQKQLLSSTFRTVLLSVQEETTRDHRIVRTSSKPMALGEDFPVRWYQWFQWRLIGDQGVGTSIGKNPLLRRSHVWASQGQTQEKDS